MRSRRPKFRARRIGLFLWALSLGPVLPSQSGNYLAPRPGTLALWHMDEGKGQVVHDAGPFGLHGSLAPGAAWVKAPWGRAIQSHPKTGAFQVPDTRNLIRLSYPFTLEAWVRLDDLTVPVLPILSRRGPSGSSVFEIRFMTFPAGFAFKVLDPHGVPQVLFGRMDVKAGSWHHVAVTWDGKEARLFGDGLLLSKLSLSPFQAPDLKQPLLAGEGEKGTYLRGALDEIHVAAGVLSPASFRSGWANYGQGKPGYMGIGPVLSYRGGPPSTTSLGMNLLVDKGMPSMPGLLFLSPRPASIAFGGGWLLVSPPEMVTTPIQLDGGIMGIPGSARASLLLPPPGPTILGRPLFFQVLLVDLKAPGYFSMTPGLALWFPF